MAAAASAAIRKKHRDAANEDPGVAVDLDGDGIPDVVIPAKRSSALRDDVLRTLQTPKALPQPGTRDGMSPAGKEESLVNPDAVDWLPHREKAVAIYQHHYVQLTIAFVILGNFFAIVIEKEIDPYPAEHQFHRPVWQTIDDVCNWIFVFELALNLYGSFWRPFLRSGWNYLDTVVVIVGITSLLRIDLGSLSQIKILRAFRVLRLFKRVKSLNQILVALVHSIPGVANAFLVMLIFMMVFSIVAVDLFRDFGSDGTYTTWQRYGVDDAQWGQGEGISWDSTGGPSVTDNATEITAMTARGFHYGQEYFGTFSRALYTLFQVLTGESWSEAVVRPLIFGYASNALLVGTFFTVYILLTQVVLQNVVVAVLLDKFVQDPAKPDGDGDGGDAAQAEALVLGPSDLDSAQLAALQLQPGLMQMGRPKFGSAQEADAAVAKEAEGLGVSPTKEPSVSAGVAASFFSGRGGGGGGAAGADDEMASLKADMALIKMQLHVIISRLPKPPEGEALLRAKLEA